MTYSEIIINRISTLCKERNIAFNRLAGMSGINQSTVDNIVRGITKDPRISTLHKIAIGLGMTLPEFLDFPELTEFSFEESDENN